jgi:hypothetical protein
MSGAVPFPVRHYGAMFNESRGQFRLLVTGDCTLYLQVSYDDVLAQMVMPILAYLPPLTVD